MTARRLLLVLASLLLAAAGQAQTVKDLAPFTLATKGAIIVGTGNGEWTWLAVGTDGWVLTADSVSAAGVKWAAAPGGAPGGLTSGTVFFITSGTCPSGTAEASDLDGKFLRGTLAANKDVGGTAGSDSITPAGTNSTPAFTGSSANTDSISGGTPAGTISWPVNVPAFTGSSANTDSVSGGTPAGTVAWPAGVPTFSGTALGTHIHTYGTIAVTAHTVVATKQGSSAGNVVTTATHTVSGSTQSITAGTPAGTVAWPAGVPTFSGTALSGHQHALTATGTVSWPANPPTFGGSALAGHQHSVTATGTVAAPVFSGSSFDNRPAYMKVIFCRVI